MWYQSRFNLKYQTQRLEHKSHCTAITVKTLNGDCKHSSLAVVDLEVANVEEKQANWKTIPRMFSQDDLQISSDQTATPESIQQWKCLHRIIPEMKVDRNLDVKLLIGANCLKALEPQEVISSHGVGLYAFN